MSIKIDIYSVMKNEIILLPYFLRHYERFADRIFIWDDYSTDGTKEMAEKHPKVILLPLQQKIDNKYMFKTLFAQYKATSRGSADWVMCVDADEFIYHPDLESVLEKYKADGKKKIKCSGFTMFASKPPESKGQIYDEIKLGIPCRYSSKPVVFCPDMDMEWNWGAHFEILAPGDTPADENSGIKLLHYRFLGEEYYIFRSIRNNATLNPGWSPNKKYRLSDGSKGSDLEWFKLKIKEALPVVD